MTAADDMKAAFDIQHEAYRRGFLAGARAMQEAAIAQSDQFSEENGPGDVGDRHGEVCQWAGEEIAAAIRALDPEKVGG